MSSVPSHKLNWRDEFEIVDSLPAGATPKDRIARGKAFERILHSMFWEAELHPRLSFRPKGEEIDGSIWLDGRTLLVEAKWTQGPHPASSIYQFRGKVDGKLVGTVGLFVSMAGFSPDAVNALVAGKELNVVLMDGQDVREIVAGTFSPRAAIRQKLRAAGDFGTPFAPLAKPQIAAVRRIVLVESRFDAQILQALHAMFGSPSGILIVPAGGVLNMPPLLDDLLAAHNSDLERLTIVLSAGEAERPDVPELVEEVKSVLRARHLRPRVLVSLIYPSLAGRLAVAPSREPREERVRASQEELYVALSQVEPAAVYVEDRNVRLAMKGAGIYLPY
ncbi:restriction endonuclease [Microbacterium sp. NPDC056057]|uniref:restriction endonuclease n=1 Tax=Microbacterium sp. NPDC056057 TaxID=3345699 RepID=UPI0035DB26A2